MAKVNVSSDGTEPGQDKVLELLEQQLATAIDLQFRLKYLLWNSENPQISEVWWLSTALFEVENLCDLIAVRIRSLGAVPNIMPLDVPSRSLLEPILKDETEERERLKEVLYSFDRLSKHASEAKVNAAELSDETTAKLFAQIAYMAYRQIWFLGSPAK